MLRPEMVITFRCPNEDCRAELSFEDLSADRSPCPKCGREIQLHLTERMRHENVVDRCAICELDKLYVQKDFNRALGVSILGGAAALSFALWVKDWVYTAFLVIGAAAALDFILFRIWPEVTICYRCHAQYRASSPNPENKACDLGLVEKYDPLDKRAGAANPAAEWKSH
ncbi:MAG: hypothetical protein JO317_08345 [Verrucomicrobiae bacterium]|nr:hypothetical protein [Verrucomicrobiae bacterium]